MTRLDTHLTIKYLCTSESVQLQRSTVQIMFSNGRRNAAQPSLQTELPTWPSWALLYFHHKSSMSNFATGLHLMRTVPTHVNKICTLLGGASIQLAICKSLCRYVRRKVSLGMCWFNRRLTDTGIRGG